jgi:flagellar biosynthesis protein FliR
MATDIHYFLHDKAITFFLVYLRIFSFIFLGAPYIPESSPAFLKHILSASLAFSITPYLNSTDIKNIDITSILYEIFIGTTLAIILKMGVYAIRLSGELIDFFMGYHYAQIINPLTQQETGPMESFFLLLAVFSFFFTEVHHFITQCLWKSFFLLPVGIKNIFSPIYFIQIGFDGLVQNGIIMVFPFIVIISMSLFLLFFINKIFPQLSYVSLMLPTTVMLGLIGILSQFPQKLKLLQNNWIFFSTIVKKSIVAWGGYG